jgi:hypothetical protein
VLEPEQFLVAPPHRFEVGHPDGDVEYVHNGDPLDDEK